MDEWKNEIIRRLAVIFPAEVDDGERLTTILWYLNHQDEVDRTGADVPPSEWMSLRQLLEIPAAFERYARRLLNRTMKVDANQGDNRATPEVVLPLNDGQWREQIIRQLTVVFSAEGETVEHLVAVLWYLNRQDEVYQDSDVQPPEWLNLRKLLDTPAAFGKYARRLFDRTVRQAANQETNQARPEEASTLNDAPWKDEIIRRLAVVFPAEADNGEHLIAILWYLNRQDEVYRDADVQPPEWVSFRQLLDTPAAFEMYARRLFAGTMQMVAYEEAKQARLELVCQLNDAHGENAQGGDSSERTRQSWWKNLLAGFTSGIPGIATVFKDLPWGRSLFTSRSFVTNFDDLVIANSSPLLLFGFIYHSCVVAYNMRRWWLGEITGNCCAKNIVDVSVSLAGNMAGSLAGVVAFTAVGALVFGPIGIVICGLLGGILGGLAGNYTGNKLSDYLKRRFFNIPREEALENAYVFFGVQQDVEEEGLSLALNRARRRYHPDRGGKHEDFLQLQMHWQVIQVARETKRERQERRQRGRRQEQTRANAQVQREPIALQYY